MQNLSSKSKNHLSCIYLIIRTKNVDPCPTHLYIIYEANTHCQIDEIGIGVGRYSITLTLG